MSKSYRYNPKDSDFDVKTARKNSAEEKRNRKSKRSVETANNLTVSEFSNNQYNIEKWLDDNENI